MCFVNLVEPGETVIVCQNGVFGMRMKENVERCGATPIMIEEDWAGDSFELTMAENDFGSDIAEMADVVIVEEDVKELSEEQLTGLKLIRDEEDNSFEPCNFLDHYQRMICISDKPQFFASTEF